MHTVARLVLERLGHEAGNQVVFGSDALDQALHHHNLLGRQHRAVDVVHIDLVL